VTAGSSRIVVVGRQNVGKSTLVNRLIGRRAAIAHADAGVTRDRVERAGSWRGREFGVVDTAGFLHRPRGLEALAGEQAERALADAGVIMLVVDVRTGITQDDAMLARRLRTAGAPVLLVANKVDSPNDLADAADLYRLGFGEPFAVSALHGRGTGELLDRALEVLPVDLDDAHADGEEPRFAIVGRPNVGKSSVFNRLVGEERSVVASASGTTRDSVDSLIAWPDLGRVRFVDTAGMRRGGKVRGVEYYSHLRAGDAIDEADVVALVLDSAEGFTAEDRRIADRILDAGRGLVLVANKWDLVENKDDFFGRLRRLAEPFARADVVRTSALLGQGVHRLPPVLMSLHAKWTSRASTAKVNTIVGQAQTERPPERAAGPIHYATQVSAGPPTFVLFGSREPSAGYRRFVENRLRAKLELSGVPIRLSFRSRAARRGRPR
jgi:GTP-binding protein